MKDFYGPELSGYYDLVLYGQLSHKASEQEMEFMNYAFNEYPAMRLSDILDIGCGTGRFTVPLAAAGYTVTGIDMSGDMLAQCSQKLAQTGVKADLVKLSLEEFGPVSMFEGVICMDSVICYGGDLNRMNNNIKRMYGCLCRDGVAVIETWNLRSHMDLVNREYEFENSDKGVKAHVKEKNTYDPARNMLTINLEAVVTDNGKTMKGSHEEKLFIPDFPAMKHMMEKAGFRNIEMYSGFDGRPHTVSGDCMLYVGKKG